jgi:membrane-bound lytic murein transglycosylase MltF
MPKKQQSQVDIWLTRETVEDRKALENASKYFDSNDFLNVHTIEAVYAQESTFGILLKERGTNGAAGYFQMEKATALRYNLIVSEKTDQRFDMYRAASATARYLKDLDNMFSKDTFLADKVMTYPVQNITERKKFTLAAYNGGEGRIARAQDLAQKNGKYPDVWEDVRTFLVAAKAKPGKAKEIIDYVKNVIFYEVEFLEKSLCVDKKRKSKGDTKQRCDVGHWVTIGGKPVFICDKKK